MFSFKQKLDPNLKLAMNKKHYKNYRVIIHCKTLPESIEKKIATYKGSILQFIPLINCICAILSSNAIERIAEFPHVDYITLDTYALLCARNVLSSNGIAFQGRYKLTGKDICIGLVDSGVYPHLDLLNPKNKIKGFLDIINGYKYPYDDNGHGTFMSGIICGSGYQSKGANKGIAENSHIYSIKAFNSLGKGYVSDILYAIQFLVNESDKHNIKVICLPFELISNDYFIISLFSHLSDIAIKHNIAIIVPAGHNGNTEGSIKGIAILNNCIVVGGVDTNNGKPKPYQYSSAGPFEKTEKPDLLAAAANILSLNSNTDYISQRNGMKIYPRSLDEPYTTFSGTSCAAAYISGVCALLYENDPNLTFNDLVSLLKVSCKLIDIPKYVQGAGILDLNRILP